MYLNREVSAMTDIFMEFLTLPLKGEDSIRIFQQYKKGIIRPCTNAAASVRLIR